MEYLLKASVIILIFYACYKLLLQRETFFESNRWFLLIGLVVAMFIPFVVIPIYIEYTPIAQNLIVVSDGVSSQIPVEESFSWMQLLSAIYGIGTLIIFVKLGIEFSSLASLLKRNKIYKYGAFTYVETNQNVPPFSFFKYIVFNKTQFNDTELEHIINHEKVHARQFHSIDILLIHLATTLFWFNPFVWLYKKEVQQNLEFIADKEAQLISPSEKSYQTLLLKASVPNYQLVLANNFYNSLIKKRIVMLHKSKSNKLNVWKYALVLPILAIFLMSVNTKKVYVEKVAPVEEAVTIADPSVSNELNNVLNSANANEDQSIVPNNMNTANTKKVQANTSQINQKQDPKAPKAVDHEVVIITKDFVDADFEKIKNELKDKGLTVKFKGIKRNGNDEITAIKIDASSKKSNANYHTESDNPIKPIKIGFDSDGDRLSIGNSGPKHGADHAYTISNKDGEYKIRTAGKGDNVFVISGDDDKKIIVRSSDKVHGNSKAKTVFMSDDGKATISGDRVVIKEHPKGKAVWVSSDDESNVYKIKDRVVVVDKANDSIHVKRSHKGNAVWVGKGSDHKVYEFDHDGKNRFFISTDGDETPLFILNGKEISKEEMDELDPESIEKVEVLKGESATEKYGDKGKNGVVLITTKDKN